MAQMLIKRATRGSVAGLCATLHCLFLPPIRSCAACSSPASATRQRTFFQAIAPSALTDDVQEDDIWFDTAHDSKMHRWSGGKWVASFAPMLKFADGIVYGLQKPDGSETDFVLVADKFQIWDGKSAMCPFEIRDGKMLVRNALIENLSVASLASGRMEGVEIILAGTGAIRSDNYEPNEDGLILRGDGSFEFGKGTIRDSLNIGTLGNITLSPWFGQFDLTLPVTAYAPEGSIIRYSEDGSPVTPQSKEWPKNNSQYVPLILDKGMRLGVRAFDLSGHTTNEAQGYYVRNVYQVPPVTFTVSYVSVEKYNGPNMPRTTVQARSSVTFSAIHGAVIVWKREGNYATGWSTTTENSIKFGIRNTSGTSGTYYLYAIKEGMADSVIITYVI